MVENERNISYHQIANSGSLAPSKLILSQSSNPGLDKGQCYVMTANLDGETSLKTKSSTPLTKNMRSIEEIDKFVGCVQCENPNPKLGNFFGRMHIFADSNNQIETCSLSSDNLLLTGAQLKNTKEVYGVCVYAGKETKIHMNSSTSLSAQLTETVKIHASI